MEQENSYDDLFEKEENTPVTLWGAKEIKEMTNEVRPKDRIEARKTDLGLEAEIENEK